MRHSRSPGIREQVLAFLMVTIMVVGMTLIARQDSHASGLRERAEAIIQFDEAHLGKLPGNQVRALALALEFQDVNGTRELVKRLEIAMKHQH